MNNVTDKYAIREMNENLVLRKVMQQGIISRANLAKELTLNKTSVSAIVADLIDKDLIVETGAGESSGGRKPILLMFNQKAGYSLSFDVGPDYISSLLTHLDGTFVADAYVKIAITSEAELLEAITTSIENYAAIMEKTTYGIAGICVGLHGIVNNEQLVFSPFYSLDVGKIKEKIKADYNLSVFFENEANLAALGEQKLKPEIANLVSMSVKYGIGAGIIIDESLYTGASGHAGEIGHFIAVINGRKCSCGNHGCIEQYASEYNILQRYKEVAKLESVNFIKFKQDYLGNRPEAHVIMQQFVQYMAIAINNLITAFNPEIIIINSQITNQIDGIVDLIQEQLTYKGQGNIQIKTSSLDRRATLLGGIHLNIGNFLGIKN